MNKKGSYFMSPFWWLVLGIVAVGVVIGVIAVRGDVVDVRPAEADILYKKIIECLVDDGVLKELDNNFDLEKSCRFNFTDNSGEQQFYTVISLYDFKDCNDGKCINPEYYYETGLKDLKELCGFGGKTPYCYGDDENLKIYTLKGDNEKFLDVLIVVGKVRQNVK